MVYTARDWLQAIAVGYSSYIEECSGLPTDVLLDFPEGPYGEYYFFKTIKSIYRSRTSGKFYFETTHSPGLGNDFDTFTVNAQNGLDGWEAAVTWMGDGGHKYVYLKNVIKQVEPVLDPVLINNTKAPWSF